MSTYCMYIYASDTLKVISVYFHLECLSHGNKNWYVRVSKNLITAKCHSPNSTGMLNRPSRACKAAFFFAATFVAPEPSLKLLSPTVTRQENIF